MDEATNLYKDYVLEVYNKEKKKSDIADLFIEVQVDLTPWIPEGFGTSDAVIVSNHTLHVIDLKYGKRCQGKRSTQSAAYYLRRRSYGFIRLLIRF